MILFSLVLVGLKQRKLFIIIINASQKNGPWAYIRILLIGSSGLSRHVAFMLRLFRGRKRFTIAQKPLFVSLFGTPEPHC